MLNTCSQLLYDFFMTYSRLVHYLFISSSLPVRDFSWLAHDLITAIFYLTIILTIWLVNDFFTNQLELLNLHYFTSPTSLKLLYLNYFTQTTSLQLVAINYLCTSLELLRFSHLQSSEFTKSNKLNRLAGLSLAQLCPSLFSQ